MLTFGASQRAQQARGYGSICVPLSQQVAIDSVYRTMSEENQNSISRDHAATYRIEVQGALDPSWAETYGDLHLERRLNGDGIAITMITGELPDQAALAGLLGVTFMLGMPLLSVACLGQSEHFFGERP
jgi:hypothetical protein